MIQSYVWYIQGFARKYKTLLIISVCSGILLFLLLPNLVRYIPFGKPTRYIGRVGSFSLARLPRDIQLQISYGLTYVDERGDIVPALASTFRPENDGRTYRFTIRPDVVWQDGKKVTTDDIAYNFSNIDVIRNQSDVMYTLKDDQNSQGSDSFLPASFPAVVSQPLFRQETKRAFLFWKKSVVYGLGNYTITSIIHKGPYITTLVLDSTKETIVYRFYPTEEDALTAFEHGQVDTLEHIQHIQDVSNWNNISINAQERFDQYLGLFFNTAYTVGEDRPFANKSLRLALNYAVQKPNDESRILSPIQKSSWAYVNTQDDLDPFTQDMKNAVDHYLKATIFSPIRIELTTLPSFAQKAESVKRSWEQLGADAKAACLAQNLSPNCTNVGIEVVVRIANFPDLSNYQVLLVGQQIPQDPDQYALWHSTQPTNFTHFKNARIDKLLEDGRKSTNKEERKLIYQEFARLLVKESPVIFLETIKTYTLNRKPVF